MLEGVVWLDPGRAVCPTEGELSVLIGARTGLPLPFQDDWEVLVVFIGGRIQSDPSPSESPSPIPQYVCNIELSPANIVTLSIVEGLLGTEDDNSGPCWRGGVGVRFLMGIMVLDPAARALM